MLPNDTLPHGEEPEDVALPTSTEESEQPTPAKVAQKLPEGELRGVLQAFFAKTSIANPIADRITSEHVSTMLSLRAEERRMDYGDRRHSRWLFTGFAVFVIIVAVGFSVFLADRQQDALLTDLLTKLIIALGGFGAGWGASSYFRR